MKRAPKGPESLWDKVNKVAPEFASKVGIMTDDELHEIVFKLECQEQEVTEARKEDADLKSLREQLKTASAGYNEMLKAFKLKKKLAVQTLKERGKL